MLSIMLESDVFISTNVFFINFVWNIVFFHERLDEYWIELVFIYINVLNIEIIHLYPIIFGGGGLWLRHFENILNIYCYIICRVSLFITL